VALWSGQLLPVPHLRSLRRGGALLRRCAVRLLAGWTPELTGQDQARRAGDSQGWPGILARLPAWPLAPGQSASGGSVSRVAEGHFRRKREAPLIVRGSTSQSRGHPRRRAQPHPIAPWACATSAPSHRSVDTCAGIQAHSEQSVTSDASLPAVHVSSKSPGVVCPPGSQRGSHLYTMPGL